MNNKEAWTSITSGKYPKDMEHVQVKFIGCNDNKLHTYALAYRSKGKWYWSTNNAEVPVQIVAWRYRCMTYKGEELMLNMEMNVGCLKEIIKDLPDAMPVFVACQGYCNYNFDRKQPFEDTDTFGIVHDGKLFITDDCTVDIGNGETL